MVLGAEETRGRESVGKVRVNELAGRGLSKVGSLVWLRTSGKDPAHLNRPLFSGKLGTVWVCRLIWPSSDFLQNAKKTVKMMNQKGMFRIGFIDELKAQILEMPYTKGKLSMFVLLPSWSADNLKGLEEVNVHFPVSTKMCPHRSWESRMIYRLPSWGRMAPELSEVPENTWESEFNEFYLFLICLEANVPKAWARTFLSNLIAPRNPIFPDQEIRRVNNLRIATNEIAFPFPWISWLLTSYSDYFAIVQLKSLQLNPTLGL